MVVVVVVVVVVTAVVAATVVVVVVAAAAVVALLVDHGALGLAALAEEAPRQEERGSGRERGKSKHDDTSPRARDLRKAR